MTNKTINVGTVANDGTGDTIRGAFINVNSNFAELYSNVANLTNTVTYYDQVIFADTNSAFNQANAAYNKANAANVLAHTALQNTTGTFDGTLTVTGPIWGQINATSTSHYLRWGNGSSSFAVVGGYYDNAGNGHIELYTMNKGTLTESVRLSNTGNLGIGTSITGYKLDVNGTANIVSTLSVGGTITGSSNIIDSKGDIRDRSISSLAASNPLAITDTGKVVALSGTPIYLPNAVFFAGNTLHLFNNTNSTVTLTANSNVILRAGGLTTGNRTLAANAYATLTCLIGKDSGGNTFILTGLGIT